MSKYRKYSPEEKINIVKEYLSGETSFREIGRRLGYTSTKGFFHIDNDVVIVGVDKVQRDFCLTWIEANKNACGAEMQTKIFAKRIASKNNCKMTADRL